MTHTSPRECNSAVNARIPKDKQVAYFLVKGAIVVALVVTVVLLRLYRLDELPPGISQDAGAHGLDALQVLQGEHAVFFPRNFGREGMIVYGVALATLLWGRTVLAIYLPAALASAGTVLSVFWLGQLLFDRDENGRPTLWRGLTIGGVAAGLLAVSISQTFLGRAGVRGNFLPFFLSLCIALLWSGWRKKSWWRIALSGACAGLLPYTYIPARLVPLLLFLFGLSFLPSLIESRFSDEERRKNGISHWLPTIATPSKAELQMIGTFLGCATLVAAPILLHFAFHPEHFFMRSDLVSVFQTNVSQGDMLKSLLNNTWIHLQSFGFRGDWVTRHNIPFRPMLNLWEASLFWFGVAMAGWYARRAANRILLLWLLILLLPAVLARGMMPPPSFIRMIGVTPAIFLLIGVGLWEAIQLFARIGGALQGPAGLSFHSKRTYFAVGLGIVMAGLVLVQGANTYDAYFLEAAANPRFQKEFNRAWNEVAEALNALPGRSDTVYLLPYEDDMNYGLEYVNFGFEYLYQGASPAHVFHARSLDLPLMVESTLREEGQAANVKVVQFTGNSTQVVRLLDKYGLHLESEEHGLFGIHTYTDVTLDRRWTVYDNLQPLTVRYDGGISLLGFAIGGAEGQLSPQQVSSLDGGRSQWLSLQWQVDAGLNVDYAVSLRLHNADGTRVHQQDQWLLLGHLYNAPTSRWTAGEPVDTLVSFSVPSDLPAGRYELRLVVYDINTLTPTVEIDVWEPEVVLTDLQIGVRG